MDKGQEVENRQTDDRGGFPRLSCDEPIKGKQNEHEGGAMNDVYGKPSRFGEQHPVYIAVSDEKFARFEDTCDKCHHPESDDDIDGKLILGEYPHEYDSKKYDKKDYKQADLTIDNNNDFHTIFNEIYFYI